MAISVGSILETRRKLSPKITHAKNASNAQFGAENKQKKLANMAISLQHAAQSYK